ncbi:MAG: hypothetical protein WBK28_00535 [Minisyncoccia bacterium]
MQKLFLAAVAATLLLSACNRTPAVEEPALDRARIAENRQIIADCEAHSWTTCDKGFIRLGGNLYQILSVDPSVEANPPEPRHNELTSARILAHAADGEEEGTWGERFLSDASFILPSDRVLWRAALIESGEAELMREPPPNPQQVAEQPKPH